jgi:excisionase family DNA binding protein
MPPKGNLLTVAEAAKALGVTAETVRRYIRERKLKAEKKRIVGLKKVWLVSPDEIHRFQDD